MNKKQVIRINENQLRQIVEEIVQNISYNKERLPYFPDWCFDNQPDLAEYYAKTGDEHSIRTLCRLYCKEFDIKLTKQFINNSASQLLTHAHYHYGLCENKTNKNQVVRLNENELNKIVKEALQKIVLEGVGDEYLDNNDKRYDRTIRFDGVKDNQDALDRANADRLIHHRKSRGVKTKGDLSDRDFWRRQTEKGNPLIKYKRNPKEWLDNLLSQSDD